MNGRKCIFIRHWYVLKFRRPGRWFCGWFFEVFSSSGTTQIEHRTIETRVPSTHSFLGNPRAQSVRSLRHWSLIRPKGNEEGHKVFGSSGVVGRKYRCRVLRLGFRFLHPLSTLFAFSSTDSFPPFPFFFPYRLFPFFSEVSSFREGNVTNSDSVTLVPEVTKPSMKHLGSRGSFGSFSSGPS